MPAKHAPKPRKFFTDLTEDSWATSAPPPMPPPLPTSLKPSPPRDEDSPGRRSEQFLIPADCLHLLQRATDTHLRAIELLTQCRVRVHGDSASNGRDFSRVSIHYRDRCGDPRACERLLNSLLARRLPQGLAAVRLQKLPPKSPSPAQPASPAAAAEASGTVALTACLGAIADDILRGSSFVHCCGIASAVFAAAEAAVRVASINLKLPEDVATRADADSIGSVAPTCAVFEGHREDQPLPLRSPVPALRLASHCLLSLRFSPALTSLGVAMTTTENAAGVASVTKISGTVRSTDMVSNIQILPSPPQRNVQQLVSQDDEVGDDDVLSPLPVARLLHSLPIGVSVILGSEMLTRF